MTRSPDDIVEGLDGMPMLQCGQWAEEKFELAMRYATAFNVAIQAVFHNREYIDLFAGSGLLRLKDSEPTNEIGGCAFRALAVKPEFTRFHFCEIEERLLDALKERIRKHFPDQFSKCKFYLGDSNVMANELFAALPIPTKENRFLGFCVVDPFGLSGFNFETIRILSKKRIDFLVLVPSGMDARRNQESLLTKNPEIADTYLGQSEWREEWEQKKNSGLDFGVFMLDQFGKSMKTLGYKYDGPDHSFAVRLPKINVLLYHMAFFSQSSLGAKLFKECKKYMRKQIDLFGGDL